MKVGKLQLHQGMFPQAMKNLRLVSVPKSHAVLSVGRPLPFDFYQLYTSVQTHALIHTHAHKCLKKKIIGVFANVYGMNMPTVTGFKLLKSNQPVHKTQKK